MTARPPTHHRRLATTRRLRRGTTIEVIREIKAINLRPPTMGVHLPINRRH